MASCCGIRTNRPSQYFSSSAIDMTASYEMPFVRRISCMKATAGWVRQGPMQESISAV